jgi:hypothetical protein
MHHHIVAQSSFRNKVQRDLAHNPAKLHAGRPQRPLLMNFEDFTWYGKAHSAVLHIQYITGRYRDL